MRRNQFVQPRYARYIQTKQPTLVGHEKSMATPCKCNQSSQIIVGDPGTNFEKRDLLNFKDDIVCFICNILNKNDLEFALLSLK